jgi:surfactin synthase thioesterase subunit
MTPSPDDRRRWLRRFDAAPEDAPVLVCFPHAGGSATYYRPLSRALSPRAAVFGVQYPGRQDRRDEAPATDLHALSEEIAGVIGVLADRRLVLLGHSMGAVLAFEVATRLEGSGAALGGLVVSGRPAPSRGTPSPVHDDDDAVLVERARRLGGTDPRLFDDPEMRALILPALRADTRAIDAYRYRPGPPLRADVVALVGDEDPLAPVDDVRAWREHTTGRFGLRVLSGGHFAVTAHPDQVVEVLTGALTGPG